MLETGQQIQLRHSNLAGIDNALVDATSISGILYINQVDTGQPVTITHVSLGEYNVNAICPSLADLDFVQLIIYDVTDGLARSTILLQETINLTGTQVNAITIETLTHLPIELATVWVTADLMGMEQLTGFMITNLYGKVQTSLALDQICYLWVSCPGYQSIQGQEFTVELNNIFTLQEQVLPLTEINSYATIEYTDAYLTTRLFSEPWFLAPVNKKTAALVQATKIIDTLSFRGLRETTEQPLSWPRILETGSEACIPTEIYLACCEIALALISGINPENEFRNVNKTSQGYGALRTTKDTKMVDPHLVHGVVSITAWNFLRPYLTDISCAIMFQGS